MDFESSFARVIDLVITGRCRSRSGNCTEQISHFDHFFRNFFPEIFLRNFLSRTSYHDSDLKWDGNKVFKNNVFMRNTKMMNFRAVSKNVLSDVILGYSYLVTLKMNGLGSFGVTPNLKNRSQMDVSVRQWILEGRLLVQSSHCILAIACNNLSIISINVPILYKS